MLTRPFGKVLAIVAIMVVSGVIAGLGPQAAAAKSVQMPYGYPWHGHGSISITITDHTSPAWRANIEQVAAAWSLSPVVDVTVTPSDGACSQAPYAPAARAKVTICDGAYGLGDLHPGETYMSVSRSGYLTGAAVYLDDSYFDGYWWAGVYFPPYTLAQRQNVVCQELGHVMGLAEGNQLCSAAALGALTTPSDANFDQLLALYGW